MKSVKMYLFLVTLSVSSGLFGFGYTITLKNETDGQVKAVWVMSGPGVCEGRERIINAGKKVTFDVGLCCTDTLSVEALSGTAYKTGKSKINVDTPKTGWDISCQGYTTVVINTANGGLSAYNE